MDTVRIGLIGVNGRGAMGLNMNNPGRSLVTAGADINEESLKYFYEKLDKNVYITTDYKKMLERKDIDAVGIFSPDHMHEEHTVAALKAGKHVYLEKPMALSVKECDNIIKAWKESGKKLMIGFNMRYMNMVRTMKQIVDDGTIGEIKAVWIRHFVGRGSEYYYHDWHAERKNCNSLLLQKGSHDIDVMHYITGKYTKKVSAFGSLDFFGGNNDNNIECPDCPQKETCPEYIERNKISDGFKQTYKYHPKCVFRKEVDIEDNMVMIMELEGGIKATYTECHFTPDYHRNYTFIGTEGRLENLELENKVIVKTRKSGKMKDYSDRIYNIKKAEGGHSGADPVICREFIDMIINDTQPPVSPIAGRMSVAAGCAGAESMRAGGKTVIIK